MMRLFAISIGCLLFTASFAASADVPQPTALDRLTAQLVLKTLEQDGLTRPKLDEQASEAWCRSYISSLDREGYFFEKGDVDALTANGRTLATRTRDGDLSLAVEAYARLQARAAERLTGILELLREKPDFTKDETCVARFAPFDYPASSAEARERWRKRVKLDLLRLVASGLDEKEAARRLEMRYRDFIRTITRFEMSELLEAYLNALPASLNTNDVYLSARAVQTMQEGLHLSLVGVGLHLATEDGVATVTDITPGGSADKDGRIQIGDKLVGFQPDDGGEVNLIEAKLSDIVSMIRGAEGTKAVLIIQRGRGSDRIKIDLTRQKIDLSDEHAKGQVVETKGANGQAIKVGVLRLPSLYGQTAEALKKDPTAASATRDCRRLLEGFKSQGVDAVILDLRGNTGGLLTEAIGLPGLFIDQGPVMQLRGTKGVQAYSSTEPKAFYTGPLAVVIDGQTGSGAEILAGVIKDYGRGIILGESRTAGRCVVQEFISVKQKANQPDISDLGALKLVTHVFYRVNGDGLQGRGIQSDISIPTVEEEMRLTQVNEPTPIEGDRVPEVKHDSLRKVSLSQLSRLQARSEARRQSNSWFKTQQATIKKAILSRVRNTIPLNLERFRAEMPNGQAPAALARDSSNARSRAATRAAWQSNDYNDELLAIVADYVTLSN